MDLEEMESEQQDSCEACAEGQVRCETYGGACSQFKCVEGCITNVWQSIEYGICSGPDGAWCVMCNLAGDDSVDWDSCTSPWENGDADNDTDTHPLDEEDGFLSSNVELRNESLGQDEAWENLLAPGEKRLSVFGLADGLQPMDVNGDYVVWCHSTTGRLFAYQISRNWVWEIAIDGIRRLCSWVTVDEDKVYTLAPRDDHRDEIYRINLTRKTYRKMEEWTSDAQSIFRIHARNGRVTWSHSMLGKRSSIALYDTRTNIRTFITDGTKYADESRLSDKYIVWRQTISDNSEIWLWDFETETTVSLTPTEEGDKISRLNPTVYGNLVSWDVYDPELQGGKRYEIFYHDLDTHTTVKVNTTNDCGDAWVDESRLIYGEKDDAGKGIIYVTDFENNQTQGIYGIPSGLQFGMRLSGRWMVYLDDERFPYPSEDHRWGLDVMLFDLCTMPMYEEGCSL